MPYHLLNATWSDQGTLSGSTPATGYPLASLQNPLPHLEWRSSSLISAYVQLATPSAYGGSATVHVWLGYTNARSSDKWRIRASADSSPDTSPDYDSTEVPILGNGAPGQLDAMFPAGVHAYATFVASFSVVSIRLDFNFTGHPDGYVRAARLVVASDVYTAGVARFMVWNPSRMPRYGSGAPTEVEPDDGERAAGGSSSSSPRLTEASVKKWNGKPRSRCQRSRVSRERLASRRLPMKLSSTKNTAPRQPAA